MNKFFLGSAFHATAHALLAHAASSLLYSISKQYASSDQISYFSLSVGIDLSGVLFISLLVNNMLVYLLLFMINIQNLT